MENELLITFPSLPQGDATQLADSLKKYLLENIQQESKIVKERDDTMDFGATLVVVLGTSSIIAIARGIAYWIMQHQNRKVSIHIGDAKLEGENLSSDDIKIFIEKTAK